MTLSALVEAVLTNAFPGWRAIGRRAWCTRQQSRLHARDRRVVWVHDGEKMPWALWGADNGFFEVEWAGRLPYLRAVPALG
jgi:hypothetical protein